MSDVTKKLEEINAVQEARRRRFNPYDEFNLDGSGTHDPLVKAQFKLTEQPVPPGTEDPAAPAQDVLVRPEDEVQEPPPGETELPGPEEPEVNPDSDATEEKQRALFNTLSELIDMGRIEADEADIRDYVETHEDELGDLLDVLDDVLEMLIGGADIVREPKTFDDIEADDGEQDEYGDGFDELKPGMGGQVPRGGTTTTVIASDQTETDGRPVVERILAGEGVDQALKSQKLREEVLELEFAKPEDLDQAMKIVDSVGVAATNVLKAGPTTMNVVRDERNAADVERQLSAIREAGIQFEEKAAVEGAATGPQLVSSPNIGQAVSTVQSESVNEQVSVTRTGMAVEVAFGNKQQAAAAKGALLQYKGIDSVQETGNGNLVVFTTDYDPEEARNRVETIMQNARVPMEGVEVFTYEPVFEANLETIVPIFEFSVACVDEQEQEAVAQALRKARGFKDVGPIGYGRSTGEQAWYVIGKCDNAYDEESASRMIRSALEQAGVQLSESTVTEVGGGASVATGRAVPPVSSRYQGPDLMPAPLPSHAGGKGSSLEAAGGQCESCGAELSEEAVMEGLCQECGAPIRMTNEQAGPQDPETKEKYMKPFYAPDDEEDVDLGEPVEEPISDETPLEEPPVGDEEAPGATIWTMEVPESPEEKERLTAALDAAQELGVVSRWVEVGAVGEPEGDVLVPPDDEPPAEVEPGDNLGTSSEEESEEERILGEQSPSDPDLVPDIDLDAAGTSFGPGEEMPVEEPPIAPEEPVDEPANLIAVEFSEDTPQEEMDAFPEWIEGETGDPETGEPSVLISGWSPAENPEEILAEFPEESPEEIPGMSGELSPEELPEPDLEPGVEEPDEDLVGPDEERILGEDSAAAHVRTIHAAYSVAKSRGDVLHAAKFRALLDHHARRSGYDRRKLHLLLHEGDEIPEQGPVVFYVRAEDGELAKRAARALGKVSKSVEHVEGMPFLRVAGASREKVEESVAVIGDGFHVDEQVYYDPGEEKIGRHQVKHYTKDVKAPSLFKQPQAAPDVPADIQKLKDDYFAAKSSGDDALAQRIRGELEFMAQAQGLDVKQVLGEACATPGKKIRSKGKGRGKGRGRGKGPRGVPAGKK